MNMIYFSWTNVFYHELGNVIWQHLVHPVQKLHIQSSELCEIHCSLETLNFFTGSSLAWEYESMSTSYSTILSFKRFVQSHQDFLHLCDIREIPWTDLMLPLQLWIPDNIVSLWVRVDLLFFVLRYSFRLCWFPCICAWLEVCFTLDQNNRLRCWSCIWKDHGKVFLIYTILIVCSHHILATQ